MTFSLEENSPATVFQKDWKSAVDEMILPELNALAVAFRCIWETYYRP